MASEQFNIPVFLEFDYKRPIGRASFNGDNNILSIQLTDAQAVELLKPDIREFSISPAYSIDAGYKIPYSDSADHLYPVDGIAKYTIKAFINPNGDTQ